MLFIVGILGQNTAKPLCSSLGCTAEQPLNLRIKGQDVVVKVLVQRVFDGTELL